MYVLLEKYLLWNLHVLTVQVTEHGQYYVDLCRLLGAQNLAQNPVNFKRSRDALISQVGREVITYGYHM